jgi:hypothetical protein
MSKMTVSALFHALEIAMGKWEAAIHGEKTNYGQVLVVKTSVSSVLHDCQAEIKVPPDVQLHINEHDLLITKSPRSCQTLKPSANAEGFFKICK